MPTSLRQLADQTQLVESVLARWPDDNLYYKVDVLACNKKDKTCQVRFEDGIECSMKVKDLHAQLDAEKLMSNDEQICCCICEGDSSVVPNAIILCDLCQQGYHQKCHSPPIDSSKIDEDDGTENHRDWLCETCSYILSQTSPQSPPKNVCARRSRTNSKSRQTPKQRKKVSIPIASPPSPRSKEQQKTEPEQSQPKPLQPIVASDPTLKQEVSKSTIKSEGPCDLTKPKKEECRGSEKLHDGSIIEEMQPFITDATKKLAEQEITTEDFVFLVSNAQMVPDKKVSGGGKPQKTVIQRAKKIKVKAPAY